MAKVEIKKTEWSKKEAEDHVRIQRAQNGYLAYLGQPMPHATDPWPYVFESFEALQDWLKARLEPDTDQQTLDK